MGRSRRIKKSSKTAKDLKKIIQSGELNNMFNQMLGIESADPQIAAPRYHKCKIILTTLYSFMDKFAKNELLVKLFPSDCDKMQDIAKFSDRIKDVLNNEKVTEKMSDDQVSSIYLDIKKADIIKALFVVHAQIKEYKEYIEDINNLDDKFILEAIGYEVFPFKKICGLNLYTWWCKEPPDDAKTFILKFLHQIYKLTKSLCELLMKADVDISNFSELLVLCISEVKKSIPNCEDAFKRILNAVSLLETNFDDYYKDFIKTENPSIIFMNFIGDVSKQQTKTNIKLLSQFKRILIHFQKMSNNQAKDSFSKDIFKTLNSQMSVLENISKNENIENLDDIKLDCDIFNAKDK